MSGGSVITTGEQIFTDIAHLEGKIVAVKWFPKIVINMGDRKTLMDFKHVS